MIGGLFRHQDASHPEQITIPVGGEATVSCTPFLGLRLIHINVTVDGVSKDYEGHQLLFLTLLQP